MGDDMEEKTLINATAVFLVRERKVLLARKTRKIGKDCWNGYGGGIENDESVKEAAAREFQEEAGGAIVSPNNLEKIAVVDFHNTKSDGGTFVCRVHVFLAREWQGEASGTEEMATPTWFDVRNLPLGEMMPADKDWLPLALNGKKLITKAYLGPFQKEKLRETEIIFVDSFPDDL